MSKKRHSWFLFVAVTLSVILSALLGEAQAQQTEAPPRVAIAVHGGAGTILPENMTSEQEAQYRAGLREALRAGYAVLSEGGTSLDAVVTAVQILEDSPLFNAGRGAVFTAEGTVELDASIMDGRRRAAGAVGSVKRVQSPIALARRVLDVSPHVLLVGEGAEEFAEKQGLPLVENSYFYTDERRSQLDQVLERQQGTTGQALFPDSEGWEDLSALKYGTVGAVALDLDGNLAAGTSTGGMTAKQFGRLGDVPVIGAGTYADNATCAVSATGHGEFFIRGVVAHDIAAMMRYAGLTVDEAANAVVMGRLAALGGTGGVIALSRDGTIAMPFNTPGMYRGYIDTEGEMLVQIYK